MRFDEIIGLLPRLRYHIYDFPGAWFLLFEVMFWVVVALLTIGLVRYRPSLLEKAEARLRALSQHTRFWLVAFGVIAIVFRLSLLHWVPVPTPGIHDEFSYLLGADTFAHGRLTNPPSPMWQHFESFHINVEPTYQSMYPPAQGLTLALGQRTIGVPWAGVLLSVGVLCSATYWMLLGWMPAPWAWLGAAFVWARFGIFSYWTNSYLGGAVAAIGGALVLGAFPRLRKEFRIGTSVVFAVGLLILANSRPLEGFLFSFPLLIALMISLVKHAKIDWRATMKLVLPSVALLAVGAAGMLYYNWRGTGNPLLMPYVVNLNEYHITKPFLFEKPNPIPVYRHQSLRAFYVMHELQDLLRWKYMLPEMLQLKAGLYYGFLLWPFLFLLIPCLYAIWKSEARIVLFSLLLLCADLFAQIWYPEPHYIAPAAAAVVLILLLSVRYARNAGGAHALWGSRALAIAFAVWLLCPVAELLRDPLGIRPNMIHPQTEVALDDTAVPSMVQRAAIQSELLSRGGKHIVIVHYPHFIIPWQEWVYNGADLDHASVVWARDMGLAKNQELIAYYRDRQVWYINVADSPVIRLQTYDNATAAMRLALTLSKLDSSPELQAVAANTNQKDILAGPTAISEQLFR